MYVEELHFWIGYFVPLCNVVADNVIANAGIYNFMYGDGARHEL